MGGSGTAGLATASAATPSVLDGLNRYFATMTLYAVRRSWAAFSEGASSDAGAPAAFRGAGGGGNGRLAVRSRTSQAASTTASPATTTLNASSFFDNETYPFGAPDAVPPADGVGVVGSR